MAEVGVSPYTYLKIGIALQQGSLRFMREARKRPGNGMYGQQHTLGCQFTSLGKKTLVPGTLSAWDNKQCLSKMLASICTRRMADATGSEDWTDLEYNVTFSKSRGGGIPQSSPEKNSSCLLMKGSGDYPPSGWGTHKVGGRAVSLKHDGLQRQSSETKAAKSGVLK